MFASIFSAPISIRSFASTADKTIDEGIKSTPSRLIMYSFRSGSSSSSSCSIIKCPIVVESTPVSSTPKQVVRLAWLSKSTARTFFPMLAREYARLYVLTVLPTPPFAAPIKMILPIFASYSSVRVPYSI